MTTETADNEGKRRDLIQSLEAARESLRVHGPVPVEEIRRLFDELDDQLDDDERLGRNAAQAHPIK